MNKLNSYLMENMDKYYSEKNANQRVKQEQMEDQSQINALNLKIYDLENSLIQQETQNSDYQAQAAQLESRAHNLDQQVQERIKESESLKIELNKALEDNLNLRQQLKVVDQLEQMKV